MKYLASFVILCAFASIFSSAYAFEDYSHISSNVKICGDHICDKGEYKLHQKLLNDAQMGYKPEFQINQNYFFQLLKMPDGSEMSNFVISKDNLTAMQNNVGIFTACGSFNNGVCTPGLPTQAQPSVGYCPISQFIHEHEDGYNTKKVGISDIFHYTIPPKWCDAELTPTASAPEFNNITIFVLFASIIGSVIMMPKIGGRFK